MKANRINTLLSRSFKKDKVILKQWDKLPIKDIKDLNYKEEDLRYIIRERDYSKINSILEEVLKLVLVGELKNNKNDIEKVVIQLLQKESIFYNLSGITSYDNGVNVYEEEFIPRKKEEPEIIIEEVIEKQVETIDLDENKINMLSDSDLYYYVNVYINECMNNLKSSEEMKKIIVNDENFKKRLYNFILDYIRKGQE